MALLPSRKPDGTLKSKRKMVVRQEEAHLSHAAWVAREEHDVEKGGKTPAKRAGLFLGRACPGRDVENRATAPTRG
jgi:hypothetical protein